MGKSNKAITKCCPFCELQVAVACKSCPGCKHSFYNAKRMSVAQAVNTGDDSSRRRRTERVKREKPNYYDASEFEKKTKKKRHERNSMDVPRERGRPRVADSLKKKSIKKKKANIVKNIGKESEDEDAIVVVTGDKARQCSIILADLNRKFLAATFRT
ncbi:hypothetical protein O3M35_003816 [Rhynocoris fuscipes]|uniref:Uncharacterized protein n=1 Tax=Rhynocoris fuscipes TaxID=488301 RepID=A0AAW1CHS9_9HEMI